MSWKYFRMLVGNTGEKQQIVYNPDNVLKIIIKKKNPQEQTHNEP